MAFPSRQKQLASLSAASVCVCVSHYVLESGMGCVMEAPSPRLQESSWTMPRLSKVQTRMRCTWRPARIGQVVFALRGRKTVKQIVSVAPSLLLWNFEASCDQSRPLPNLERSCSITFHYRRYRRETGVTRLQCFWELRPEALTERKRWIADIKD